MFVLKKATFIRYFKMTSTSTFENLEDQMALPTKLTEDSNNLNSKPKLKEYQDVLNMLVKIADNENSM